jgi:hypothetical protein
MITIESSEIDECIKKQKQNESTNTDKDYEKFNYDKEFHCFENKLGMNCYMTDNDTGIYKVNVMKQDKSNINRIGIGKILARMNVKNIHACKLVSRNTACVHFNNRDTANVFVKEQERLQSFGYTAEIPSFYASVVGVVKNVPIDISATEIFDELKNDHAIHKIERMTRRLPKGRRDYALNIKITFISDNLPPHVNIYHGREKVHAYIPPVLQCTACWRYGHHFRACKSSTKTTCSKCGSKEHLRNDCGKSHPNCIHCNQAHEASARNCPERIRQNNIRILMTSEKLTFRETVENYPQYTSKNQFDLLANMSEFPQLQRNSYRNELMGKKTKVFYAPKRSGKLSSQNFPEKFSQYYAELNSQNVLSEAVTINKHKVTEVEKDRTKIAQEKQDSQHNSDSTLQIIIHEKTTTQSEENNNINSMKTSPMLIDINE